MSRIDFTPAQTTQIPTRASVSRSADSSKVSRAPRCTPPRPPVANTRIPARSARWAVAATVVAPSAPQAVGDDRALERDHWAAELDGVRDLGLQAHRDCTLGRGGESAKRFCPGN